MLSGWEAYESVVDGATTETLGSGIPFGDVVLITGRVKVNIVVQRDFRVLGCASQVQGNGGVDGNIIL